MENADYKLLVVDDDAGVRQSVVAYLEDSGFRVFEAADGHSGFALYEDIQPDLIVSDLRMPGMDGLTLLKKVHSVSAEVPIIVMSGAGVMGDVVEALRFGASDYLIKPVVDLEVLVHSIQKSLERSILLSQNRDYRKELEKANIELRTHLRSLQQDQQAGQFVQESLSPVSPLSALDYTFSHHLRPSLYLSGDCIDYALLDKRFWAFYLADVSGHGSASAFVTIWLKNLVKQLVRYERLMARYDSLPEALLQLITVINDELMATRLNNHLTCFVGILDTETQQLYYVVAGHLPMPIIVSAQGAQFLEGQGKPVGLFKQAKWEVYTCPMPESFALTLFSDGVLEVLPPEKLLDKEQYLLQLVSETSGNLSDIITALELDDVADAPDDIAMLSISRGR